MKLLRNHLNTARSASCGYVTIYSTAIFANVSELHYKTLKYALFLLRASYNLRN